MNRRWGIGFEWKLEDLWIGVFWMNGGMKLDDFLDGWRRYDVWICVLPCVPLHFWWMRRGKRPTGITITDEYSDGSVEVTKL